MEAIDFLKWIVVLFYMLSLFIYGGFFVTQTGKLRKYLPFSMIITLLLHAGYLFHLAIVTHHLPLGTVFEVMTSYVFIFVLIYFVIEQTIKDYSLGTIILLIALILQLISSIFINTDKGLADILARLPFFEVHVSTMLLAYSAFAISFIASVMYVMLSREIHSKQLGFFFSRLPSLELLDRLSNMAVSIGVTFITIGIIIGFFMASQVWQSQWVLDPKFISVFITWLVYLAFIYFRNAKGWQGRRASIISMCGFLWVLISFIVVSIFLSEIHSFI